MQPHRLGGAGDVLDAKAQDGGRFLKPGTTFRHGAKVTQARPVLSVTTVSNVKNMRAWCA